MDEYPSAPIAVEDVQARTPALSLSLSRVGVTGVEKVIRIRQDGVEQLYSAQLECFVDLGPRQKGAHMSRFEEVVNDVIGEVILGESSFRAETLAQHIAEKVRERQEAHTAEVTITARYPEHKPAPVSGIPTQEIYTLHGSAVAGPTGTRRLIGVTAAGMTACPCAQELVQASSRERLVEQGFSDDEIERVFASVPVATHNQRGLGTLRVGCPESCDTDIDALALVAIVEASMSSEIYELMKRSDEAAVVEKAHRRPRFVEDCVREMVGGVVAAFPELGDNAFVSARQENLESIHQHNVVAERFGLLGELRSELATGASAAHHVSMREWLDGTA
ncbi:MAG: cyclohydrolase [Solirubrobacteraceae bacterium]|jgi:GTP cyclohydrolase I/GTP cyclohydrolase-4|nr:cyclohydrolase [Solirubrobacteraceae bacterium]